MLKELHSNLTQSERAALSAIFEISERTLNHEASSVRVEGNLLILRAEAVGGRCCPFGAHLVRGGSSSLSFYIGMGAEVYNRHELLNKDIETEVAADLRSFLSSPIRCERRLKDGRIVAETYLPAHLTIDGQPTRLGYRVRGAPLFGRSIEQIVEYEPWIAEAPVQPSVPGTPSDYQKR